MAAQRESHCHPIDVIQHMMSNLPIDEQIAIDNMAGGYLQEKGMLPTAWSTNLGNENECWAVTVDQKRQITNIVQSKEEEKEENDDISTTAEASERIGISLMEALDDGLTQKEKESIDVLANENKLDQKPILAWKSPPTCAPIAPMNNEVLIKEIKNFPHYGSLQQQSRDGVKMCELFTKDPKLTPNLTPCEVRDYLTQLWHALNVQYLKKFEPRTLKRIQQQAKRLEEK